MKVAICDDDRKNCEQLRQMIQGQKPECEVRCFCEEGQLKEAGRYFQSLLQEIRSFGTSAGRFRGRLHFQTKSRSYDLSPEEILYVESRRRKVEIHTEKEVFSVYATMKGMEEELGEDFFRCHRGYLVNLARVKGYDTGNILLENGDRVYLAREKYLDFARACARYLGT